jgi:hypothetical protein
MVCAPVIIAALRDYFEMLWERATLLGPQHPAAPTDRLTPRAARPAPPPGFGRFAAQTRLRRGPPPSGLATAVMICDAC